MAVQERTYQDPTASAITSLINLGGTKERTTQSLSSSPQSQAALEQVLNAQLRGLTPEGSAELLRAIFQQGMEQVPGLATTYANAAGARLKNNTPMQLAMQDMFAKLATEGAKQLRANQDSASVTAGRMAESTRTQTTAGNKSPKASAMQLLPFALANAGKIKKFGEELFGGRMFGSSFENNPLGGGSYIGGGVEDYGVSYDPGISSFATDIMGGSDFGTSSFDLGGFDTAAFDSSGSDMFGFDFGGGDFASDLGGDIDFFGGGFDLGFANGGLVSKKKLLAQRSMKPKGYAEGGEVRDVRQADPRSNIRDKEGKQVRGITYNENQLDFDLLRGISSGANMLVKNAPTYQRANRQSAGGRRRGRYTPLGEGENAGSSGVGEGIAEGTVGTGITAEGLGTVASIAGMAIGVPGIAVSAAMNAMGFPTVSPIAAIVNAITDTPVTPPNPFSIDANGVNGVGTDGISPDSVSVATGISGANAGGLGGLGISIGLDAAFDPSDAPGTGVDAGPGSSGGTDGVGDAASAGVDGGGFAKGGEVDGPKGRDVIPAYLTDGEFVIKQPSVQKLGVPMLELMNEHPEAFQMAMQAMFGGHVAGAK
jgi:hypothetical protein